MSPRLHSQFPNPAITITNCCSIELLYKSPLTLGESDKSMASSLAARQALNLARISAPRSASSLIQRRGLSGAADHHGPAKVDCWKAPMSPSIWKEEHFVIVSLSGWGLLIYGGFKAFSGGKKEEKLVEAAN